MYIIKKSHITKTTYEWFFQSSQHKLKQKSSKLLGSKLLGTSVLELYFVMLANHDQNSC